MQRLCSTVSPGANFPSVARNSDSIYAQSVKRFRETGEDVLGTRIPRHGANYAPGDLVEHNTA